MKVAIKNFKSFDHLELELGRVNIIIGPPDSGKSNFLEALETFGYSMKIFIERSLGLIDDERIGPLGNYVRLSVCEDLVTESKTVSPILRIGEAQLEIRCEGPDKATLILSNNGKSVSAKVQLFLQEPKLPPNLTPEVALLSIINWLSTLKSSFRVEVKGSVEIEEVQVPRLYSFDRMFVFQNIIKGNIVSRLPPYPHEKGINLAWQLYTKKDVLNETNIILKSLSDLSAIPSPTGLEFLKESKGIPAPLVSDTILRIVYFTVALLGNSKTTKIKPVVMLEEPECHMSPISHEKIAELVLKSIDKGNSVILTTHDPILASRIYEKTDARVFYFWKEGIYTRACEVEEPELFSDMIEGVVTPCRGSS